MQLGTFGAIFTFALELEQQAVDFYDSAAQGSLEATFTGRAQKGRKRITRLERARQEGVAEMILESIVGLDGDDYPIEAQPQTDEAGLLAQAIELEETLRRYYVDASAKMPVREVARLFDRMARESDKYRTELENLTAS